MKNNVMYEINEYEQPIGLKVEKEFNPKFPEKINLEGKFCKLEPLSSRRHSEDLFNANSLDKNGECWTYLTYGPYNTLLDYKNWIQEIESLNDPLFYAIINKISLKPVGVISYLNIDIKKLDLPPFLVTTKSG